MTDGEPEPFRMPTDPSDATDAEAETVESISDLIDEATRTAAEQAALEAAGEVPEDRSADVWGDGGRTEGDVDSVWAAAEHASSGHDLWGSPDADEDVWSDDRLQRHPAPSADPTTDATASRPAAAEGMDEAGSDVEEPDTFVFAVDDDDDDRDAHPATAARDDTPPEEEPEPFRFGAGPATTAPATVPDHVDAPEEEEPESFTFAVGEDAGAAPEASTPPAHDDDRTHGADVQEWTVPSDDAADGEEEPAGDVWTFDVSTETHQDDDTEAPLAESATPRDEAGWRDLDAEEEPGWTVPDLPPRRRDDGEEEEPGAFTADVEDDHAPWTSGPAAADDTDDDAPWTSGPAAADDDVDEDAPWSAEPVQAVQEDAGQDDTGVGLPADVVTAEVHDALGDLLGHGDDEPAVTAGADAPTTAPVPVQDTAPVPTDDTDVDRFDELDDLDLDQFDDLEATAEEPPAEPAADTGDGDGDDEDDTAEEGSLDAPTAARQVMEPGSVTFSSGGGRKRRGLFG